MQLIKQEVICECAEQDDAVCGIAAGHDEGKAVHIPAQTVICALGQKPRSAEADAFRGIAPFTRVIGDVGQVGTIMQAMYQGYHIGLDI